MKVSELSILEVGLTGVIGRSGRLIIERSDSPCDGQHVRGGKSDNPLRLNRSRGVFREDADHLRTRSSEVPRFFIEVQSSHSEIGLSYHAVVTEVCFLHSCERPVRSCRVFVFNDYYIALLQGGYVLGPFRSLLLIHEVEVSPLFPEDVG